MSRGELERLLKEGAATSDLNLEFTLTLSQSDLALTLEGTDRL